MSIIWRLAKLAAWILGGLLVLNLVLSLFGIGFTVLGTVSGVAKRTLDADNVLRSYEWFFNTHAQYEVRRAQLKEFIAYMDDEPDPSAKRVLRVELSAIRLVCNDLAARYNAESKKLNRKIFKDGQQLPDQLNQGACQR